MRPQCTRGWGPGLLVAVLLLPLRGLRAAPAGPLQEQEINLKLRILVPRDNRHLNHPFGQLVTSPVSPRPMPLVPDTSLNFATLPMRTPVAPQPISVVSSLSSSVGPLGSALGAFVQPAAAPQLTHTYLVARPVSYRKRPARPVYSTYAPQLPYAQYAPLHKPVHTASYHAWPLPHTGLQYNYVGHPPKSINITMVQKKPEAPVKACNCSADAAKPEEEEEDPAPVVEDAEDIPTTPKPIADAWLGYVPPDLLNHAKNVLLKGKVNVEKDQIHFRQKWKHSNYPQHHQMQKIPGVGEDLWKALKEDLKDIATDEGNEDFHDHDSEFDDSASDGFDDGHDYETIQTEENDGRPYFVDFWGNRVPKYINSFKDGQETEQDAAHDYNSDPHGWNPQYTKGMWTDNDQHLQVFSGYQHQPQQDPNEPKPVYDNGLGERYEDNYNRYVADNGTWVGPPAPHVPNNLREILKNSVSYEEGLENPSDKHATYADVIRYLNSKKLPMRVRQRKLPRPRRRPAPRPRPWPWPRPRPPQPRPVTAPSQYNPNLVDVNQLVEALILHKERERARKLAEQLHSRNSVADDGGFDYDDDEQEVDEEEVGEVDEKPPARISNAHASPPVNICKGIRDVGVTQDGHEMAHVQGVVCTNSYDYSADEGTVEAAAEDDKHNGEVKAADEPPNAV